MPLHQARRRGPTHNFSPSRLALCSYLGYGLMAGRAAVLSEAKDKHPCIPSGYQGG